MSGGVPLPDFVRALPGLDLPLSEEVVTAHALRSDDGLAVWFTFHQDCELPPHTHGDQWGTVLAGRIAFTRDGVPETMTRGDSYFIPAGVEHGAKIAAGTVVLDVFAEPDRYALTR